MFPALVVGVCFLTGVAHAAVNGRCTGSKATGPYKDHGICISTKKCNSYEFGNYISGACPNDPNDIKCCVVDGCSMGIGFTSWCDWTSNGCEGTRFDNMCPGGNNFKCCALTAVDD